MFHGESEGGTGPLPGRPITPLCSEPWFPVPPPPPRATPGLVSALLAAPRAPRLVPHHDSDGHCAPIPGQGAAFGVSATQWNLPPGSPTWSAGRVSHWGGRIKGGGGPWPGVPFGRHRTSPNFLGPGRPPALEGQGPRPALQACQCLSSCLCPTQLLLERLRGRLRQAAAVVGNPELRKQEEMGNCFVHPTRRRRLRQATEVPQIRSL